jgi:hypothetical protein
MNDHRCRFGFAANPRVRHKKPKRIGNYARRAEWGKRARLPNGGTRARVLLGVKRYSKSAGLHSHSSPDHVVLQGETLVVINGIPNRPQIASYIFAAPPPAKRQCIVMRDESNAV